MVATGGCDPDGGVLRIGPIWSHMTKRTYEVGFRVMAFWGSRRPLEGPEGIKMTDKTARGGIARIWAILASHTALLR